MTPGSSSSKKRKPKKHDAADDDKPAAAAAKKQKRQQDAVAATTTSSTATTATTTENGPASTATAIDSSSSSSSYTPLSLSDIQARILLLCDRVPNITDSLQPQIHSIVYEFASSIQSVLEEFWLLCGLINSATYTWGTDRSGASEQNLSLLSNELSNSQEQLNTVVTPRLTNILAPIVDLVTDKVVVQTENGDSSSCCTTKQHVFKAQVVDEEFVQLCRTVLCRKRIVASTQDTYLHPRLSNSRKQCYEFTRCEQICVLEIMMREI